VATATAFHVVIERPRDAGTGAANRLAEAVAQRYGIPVAQLQQRLATGRLRVKSNVDLATAETFAADLEQLGAVCAILDAGTGEPIPPKPVPAPAPKPRPSSSALPSPLASVPRPDRPAAPSMASGLAAAYSTKSESPQQDLGALGSGEFALSTLDGNDDNSPAASTAGGLNASFGPPAAPVEAAPALPASFGPPTTMSGPPMDLFAPPDAATEDELTLDAAPKRPGKVAAAPEPGTLAMVAEQVRDDAPAPPTISRRSLADWVGDVRVRLAAGVLLAILVGFIPATVITTVREQSAFAEIDTTVKKRFESIYSETDWNALDPMLVRERGRKQDERRNIALGSMVIWALAGAGVAFVWFRKIDWDRAVARLS
jgi:hypothetical protein